MARTQKKLRGNPLRRFPENTVIESALLSRGGLTRKCELAFVAGGKVHSVDSYGDELGIQRAWEPEECVSFVTRRRSEPGIVHERDGELTPFPEMVGNRVVGVRLMDGRGFEVAMVIAEGRLIGLNAAGNIEWIHHEDVVRWAVPGSCIDLTGYHREAGRWFVRHGS